MTNETDKTSLSSLSDDDFDRAIFGKLERIEAQAADIRGARVKANIFAVMAATAGREPSQSILARWHNRLRALAQAIIPISGAALPIAAAIMAGLVLEPNMINHQTTETTTASTAASLVSNAFTSDLFS
jgi:hypothetical protein